MIQALSAFWQRLVCAYRLVVMRKGLLVEVESRFGAHRTRKRFIYTGQLLRVDIPLPKKDGVTSSPLGEIRGHAAHQAKVDEATAVRSFDACPYCTGTGRVPL